MNIENLLTKSNGIPTIHLLLRIMYHGFFIALSLFFSNYLILAIFFAIPNWIVFSFFGFAGLSHELFHLTVFTNKKINIFLCYLFMLLVWENYSFFKVTHWKHHQMTLDKNDPEPVFKGKINSIYLFQLLTFDFKSFYNRIKILIKNSIGIVPVNNIHFTRIEINKIKLNSRLILLYILLSFVFFIYLKLYPLIFLITLAPFFFTFFNKILAFAQHYGLQSLEKNDFYLNSRTVILNKYWSFFYSYMNYHIEHHLNPMIPYYNLNKFHQSINKDNKYVNVCKGWFDLIYTLDILGLFIFRKNKQT
jgi:fatty acid desaturase